MKSLARTLVGPFAAAAIIAAFELLSPFESAGLTAAAAATSAAAIGALVAGILGGIVTTAGIAAYLAITSADIAAERSAWAVAAISLAGLAITGATAFLRKRGADLPRERSRRAHLEKVLDNLDAIVWETTPDLSKITYIKIGRAHV
jgi:hypothetical protein